MVMSLNLPFVKLTLQLKNLNICLEQDESQSLDFTHNFGLSLTRLTFQIEG